MNKTLKIILIIIAAVVVLGIVLLFLRGSEDRWICEDGQWVKHGVPSAEKPTESCGESISTQTTTIQISAELQKKIDELYSDLHSDDSGNRARQNFPDLEEVYVDNGENSNLPEMILPFRYYYSPSADITVSICQVNATVFICKGKKDTVFSKDDIEKCEVTGQLLDEDSRLK